MALQDQRQDAVLKKSYRSAILLLAITGGGAGFGFLVLTSSVGGASLSVGDLRHVAEVSRPHSSPLSADGAASAPRDLSSNANGHPYVPISTPSISPGLPPPSIPGTIYNFEEVRSRIAAIQRGNLNGDHQNPVDRVNQSSHEERRAGSPAIAAEGNLITVHIQHLTAALTLDPVALRKSTAILAFPGDEMYRLEAPINGAGVMVNDQFVPPGASLLIGTGSVVHLSGATDIHLRPAEPIKPPLGSG